MAYQATNWAWEQDLPMAQKFVLVALADMADEHLTCFPGQKRIAAMVGSSERTVRRALADLEELGLIERESRRSEVGYRTSDRYLLRVKKKASGHIGRKSNRTESPRTMRPISPANDDSLTGHSDRAVEAPENHQKEPPDKREGDDALFALAVPGDGDLFERFWAVWPRKAGKKTAAEAWVKALGKVNQHAIIAAATAYAESPNRPELKFVPHPSTWLNQERWNDPLPVATVGRESVVDQARRVDAELRRRAESERLAVSA